VIFLLSKEIKQPRLVELVSNTISDSLELEIEFLLLIAEVSVTGNMNDLGLSSDHFFKTLEVDGLLADLEVFSSTLEDLYQAAIFQVGG
jgi:hypothetical protein